MRDDADGKVYGFVGLGSQGAPIARRMIDAGLPTVLWARRRQTLDPFRAGPARFAADLRELGAAADHVGVCVYDDDDVREVCAALFSAMRRGGLIAVHSTTLPTTCQELAREAAALGLSLLDAPVSGGAPAAEQGKLTVMAGGDRAAFEAAKPVFETFGELIVHLGEIGAGQNAKLINNSLMSANLGLVHAAAKIGASLGVERRALLDLLKASSGSSFALEVYARQADLWAFAHARSLFEKVRLLGEVEGVDPRYHEVLRASAAVLLEALNAPKS